MYELHFHLNLSYEQALAYYQGRVSSVMVTVENGQRLSFPALHLRPFIDATGVRGYFRITFDADHKFVSLTKVSA